MKILGLNFSLKIKKMERVSKYQPTRSRDVLHLPGHASMNQAHCRILSFFAHRKGCNAIVFGLFDRFCRVGSGTVVLFGNDYAFCSFCPAVTGSCSISKKLLFGTANIWCIFWYAVNICTCVQLCFYCSIECHCWHGARFLDTHAAIQEGFVGVRCTFGRSGLLCCTWLPACRGANVPTNCLQ